MNLNTENPFTTYVRAMTTVEEANPKLMAEVYKRFENFQNVWKSIMSVITSNPDILDDGGIESFEYVDACIKTYEDILTSQIDMMSN